MNPNSTLATRPQEAIDRLATDVEAHDITEDAVHYYGDDSKQHGQDIRAVLEYLDEVQHGEIANLASTFENLEQVVALNKSVLLWRNSAGRTSVIVVNQNGETSSGVSESLAQALESVRPKPQPCHSILAVEMILWFISRVDAFPNIECSAQQSLLKSFIRQGLIVCDPRLPRGFSVTTKGSQWCNKILSVNP